MIAFLGYVRLVNVVVVFDQIRIPLVGLATEEAVETVEALLQGPGALVPAGPEVLLRHVVVLSQPVRAPARILEDVSDRGALRGDATMMAGEAVGGLRDAGKAVEVVVPAGQDGGSGR
jgi:hypothetical protein